MKNKDKPIELEDVVIRFSGDSGDGMQLTGTLFSNTAALLGNDIATFPDYPAEIRAPQGTVGGVSGFQVHFGHSRIKTPGDLTDVLVAMNPAALKANARWLKPDAMIIIDVDNFTSKNINKAGYKEDPIREEKLEDYNVIQAPITSLTKRALEDMGLDMKSVLRSKNMFALGMIYWVFNRPLKYTKDFFKSKFKKKPEIIEANERVLKAGYYYAETIEALHTTYIVKPAEIEKGTYRNINGNTATAWGFIAAAEKAGLQLFVGSYPITPATGILEELALRKNLGVITVQAEDEIAGITTSIGASFAGLLAATTTSGPGLALKSEALGLAVITELPLVVVDVQRGGPSTGLPTKTEQSDLMQVLFGRSGESPVAVIAASTPANCFYYAFEAARIALEHMTPVVLMTDGFLANGSEPWRIPKMSEMPEIKTRKVPEGADDYQPYKRDPETLARGWAIPGTPGLEHRIGGLEKDEITGNVSYDPVNHQMMTNIRAEKIKQIVKNIPELEAEGEQEGDVLLVGWGSTYGHLKSAQEELDKDGKKVGLAHFNYINPLPGNVTDVFGKYKKILVCELNMGQFANYLRMNYPQFDYHQLNKVQGLPFTLAEIKEAVNNLLEG
ncbi:MAG TPA: 2-oxoacid:acceptor oxidoreductase subunit alpha [Bacteroidetes bacterium]|nr:2-oxoacid:acceptor oxidoreductase subunit alpha [Bacteroidota bacterium]